MGREQSRPTDCHREKTKFNAFPSKTLYRPPSFLSQLNTVCSASRHRDKNELRTKLKFLNDDVYTTVIWKIIFAYGHNMAGILKSYEQPTIPNIWLDDYDYLHYDYDM